FYDSVNSELIKYAVIVSRYKDKWVFCKHKERNTFEIPGGHREEGETPTAAAMRELMEETGAVDFNIYPVCVYSVIHDSGSESFGMLYYAEILEFEQELKFEIESIHFFDGLPDQWTYPLIQPKLLEEVKKRRNI
ncbi:MAG: NUDIX domain-containing protein, partial [Ruminiclostridium sp.]|nr:NUDIX domain-containing protein [Ruminiclostridium sp.]